VNFEENPSLLKEKKNVKRTVGLINHAIELAKPIEGKKKKKKKKLKKKKKKKIKLMQNKTTCIFDGYRKFTFMINNHKN